MTTNTQLLAAPTITAHHGRTRRMVAVAVIATAAWAGVHTLSGPAHNGSGPATPIHPQATTDWIATNR